MVFRSGLITGSLWGAALAFSLTALLLLTALVQVAIRSLFGVSTPHAMDDLPFGALMLAYFVGGVSAGAALGVLWPRVGGLVPATLAGTFAAILFVTAVRVALHGFTDWTVADLVGIYVRAWLIGSTVTLVVWVSSQYQKRKRGWR